MTRKVVFVGWHEGAARAAERLGLQVLLVEASTERISERRRPGVRRRLELSSDGSLDGVAAALGEEGDIQAIVALTEAHVLGAAHLRQVLGVSGITPEVALRCRDKLAMRLAAKAHGISCAAVELISGHTKPADLIHRLGLPLVIKQRAGSGGRGTVLVRTESEVQAALKPGWIAENHIDGVELSVESFVSDGRPIFTNPTQYIIPGRANVVPALLGDEIALEVLELNRRVLAALGVLRGMTHVELFITAGGLVFGEMAARPPGGRIMELIARVYGFDTWAAFLLVELGELPPFPATPRGAAGVCYVHPGAGRVVGVRGVAAARGVPGVVFVRCRARRGMLIPPRVGTGQSVGRIDATGPDQESVARALLNADRAISIDLEPIPTRATSR